MQVQNDIKNGIGKGPMLTSSRARSFAETIWGRGGTNAYRTNRHGVFYFACSGHGGYVVDADALTKEEYANIVKYSTPEKCLVTTINGSHSKNVDFWQNPNSFRSQRYKIANRIFWTKEVFFFEEDCAWSILEKFTDIRAKGYADPVSHETVMEAIFQRWFAKEVA